VVLGVRRLDGPELGLAPLDGRDLGGRELVAAARQGDPGGQELGSAQDMTAGAG
jgi:hypothetical protein